VQQQQQQQQPATEISGIPDFHSTLLEAHERAAKNTDPELDHRCLTMQ